MLFQLLDTLLFIFTLILFAHVIFSWVPRPPEPLMPFVLGVRRVVEPVVAPIRRRMPPLRIGGIALDLSIIVVFIGIWILRAVLAGIAR